MFKQKYHLIPDYLLNPTHPVSVAVIGVGGTGSQFLTHLARIDHALKNLGHPGFSICAYDPDTVSESNISRQSFTAADIGANKAITHVTRINRFFNANHTAIPEYFGFSEHHENLVISCVDTVSARKEIYAILKKRSRKWNYDHNKIYYWLDCGNRSHTGQVILSTITKIKQPVNKADRLHYKATLPTIFDLHPDIEIQEDTDTTPSCSLREALEKQDLLINTFMAAAAAEYIWKIFREIKLSSHGSYINLERMSLTSIPIQ